MRQLHCQCWRAIIPWSGGVHHGRCWWSFDCRSHCRRRSQPQSRAASYGCWGLRWGFSVATYTFTVEEGASREAAKDLDNGIFREVGQWIPLVGASSISSMCNRMGACSIMRSVKRKIIQQRSNSEVHNSYQCVSLTTINNFHGTTSYKFRVAPHRYI